MADMLDNKIREALEAQARQVEVPEDLAVRTMAAARELGKPGLRARLRASRDARRMRSHVTGYPRWAYAAAAAAAAVMLFTVGTLVSNDRFADTPTLAGGERDEPVSDAPGGEAAQDMATETALGTRQSRSPLIGRLFGGGDEQAFEGRPGSASEERTVQQASGGLGPDDVAVVEPGPPGRRGGAALPPQLVRTADVSVQVEEFDKAWSAANRIASAHDGFVTSSSTSQQEGRLASGWVQMRIPADRLDAALSELRELGTPVHLETSAHDIAEQIVDVEARIRTAEANELQLLELLRRAQSLSETLEVRTRLDRVREEIERLKAQQQAFSDQVAFATVNAQIFEEGAQPGGGNGGILRDAFETALRVGLTIVAGTVVVLGGLLPLAALAVGVWFIVRVIRRRARPSELSGDPGDS